MGDCDGNGDGDGDGDGDGVGDGDGDGDGKGDGHGAGDMKEGLPLHVAAMCSAFGRATPCLHPHGHKEVHSPVLHHGGDTGKSVCSHSRGRVPDS
jgi:hypothetical protein